MTLTVVLLNRQFQRPYLRNRAFMYNIVQAEQNCGNYLAILGQTCPQVAEITNLLHIATLATILLL